MLINVSDSVTARWAPRLVTFAVWALALASAVAWGLKSSADPAGPHSAVQAAAVPIDSAAVGRVLGATGPAPVAVADMAGRFVLLGVVADPQRQGGAALIALDGKPPRPYRVGSVVDEGVLLQSVEPRRAVLAQRLDGPALFALELPIRK
jgi:general secretion pathway protein C